MEVVVTFTNESTNMKAWVTRGKRGFHVALQDLDSGEFDTRVTIYPDADRAIEKAREVLA